MNGKQLKNSILQWAIQGKLVPQDPNDEPASVLLEKIRQEKERLIKEKKIKRDKNASIIYRGEDNSYYEKILATGEVKCIDEEIPFEIPQGWEWTRIGNIFNHTSGKQQSSSNKSGGTPQKFITTSNLYWGYFLLNNVKVMNFTEEEIKTCSATKGDLLVCEGGAGYGRSAIWNEDYDICLQNHVHRLRPLVDGTCEYVYYFIYLQKESNSLASVGTAMPGLSANRLKSLLIPLPPIAEQKRITNILSEVFPKVEKYELTQEKQNLLNSSLNGAIKKSILQEAIQGKLVPQIESEDTVKELLEQIQTEKQRLVKEGKLKKSALTDSVIYKGDDNKYYENHGKNVVCIDTEIPFEIPSSWQWVRLANVVQVNPKNDAPNETRAAFIPMECVDATYLSKYTYHEKKWGDIKAGFTHFADGDVAFAKITPCFQNRKSMILRKLPNGIGAGTTELKVLRPYGKTINREYLLFFLESPYFVEEAVFKGTANQQRIISGYMENKLFPLPPLSEQQRISEKIKEAYKLIGM
ncbi:restriction endonuclease subunit S [Bacteroides xylanisolvens]|uniref:restriction endonuclease subunit S n=1 Tax=Bacteroides xylanisolvens TaxID=371601 RepID=UPI001BA72B41|nr:restriction endonuclease subunit S [Bacteroides xylanisolvens]QUR44227.1 restriction endonuclease subunit S [Bacteroides xylanisolvens]